MNICFPRHLMTSTWTSLDRQESLINIWAKWDRASGLKDSPWECFFRSLPIWHLISLAARQSTSDLLCWAWGDLLQWWARWMLISPDLSAATRSGQPLARICFTLVTLPAETLALRAISERTSIRASVVK